jgi:hypothetical protein
VCALVDRSTGWRAFSARLAAGAILAPVIAQNTPRPADKNL